MVTLQRHRVVLPALEPAHHLRARSPLLDGHHQQVDQEEGQRDEEPREAQVHLQVLVSAQEQYDYDEVVGGTGLVGVGEYHIAPDVHCQVEGEEDFADDAEQDVLLEHVVLDLQGQNFNLLVLNIARCRVPEVVDVLVHVAQPHRGPYVLVSEVGCMPNSFSHL